MKAGWEVKKLGDFFEITSSKRVFQSEWKQQGVPFYRAREIILLARQGFVENDLFISEEMFNTYSKKYGIPNEGDLMVTGVGTLGNCYVVIKQDKFYFKDGNIIWFKKKQEINSKFVAFAFQSDYLKNQINRNNGATVNTYTIINAKNTFIPVPSIDEQNRIVEFLDEAFAGIAKAKENAERNLENSHELKEEYLNINFKRLHDQWGSRCISEMCMFKPEKKEARQIIQKEQFVSFLPMEDLGKNSLFVRPYKERRFGEVENSYTYFREGDVLLAKITPCFENGKLGIAKDLTNKIGFGSSEYIVMRPGKELLDEYLYFYLSRNSFRNEGAKRMNGAVGHKRVPNEFVMNSMIPCPPVDIQAKFVSKCKLLFTGSLELREKYYTKNLCLEELKFSILNEMISFD
jgi:type I restriction enzyme, S subunit